MPETNYRILAHKAGGYGNEHLVDAVARALHYSESIHAHNIYDNGYEKPYSKFKTCSYCLLRAGRSVNALAQMKALIVHDAPEPEPPAGPQPSAVASDEAACECRHLIRSHAARIGCMWCSCQNSVYPVTVTPDRRVGWAVWGADGGILSSGPGQDGEDDPHKAMHTDLDDVIIDALDEAAYRALDDRHQTGIAEALLAPGGRDFFYTQVVRR